MKIHAVAGAVVLGLFSAAGAAAQQLETGKWTGKVIVPVVNAPEVRLHFDVKNENGVLSVTLAFTDAPMSFPLKDVKIADKRLTFSFEPPNAIVRCDLGLQEDKSWDGDCIESGDPAKVRMIMTPPKKDGGE